MNTDDIEQLLDRNTYRRIKKMDRVALEGLIQDIFEQGRKKGLAEAGVIIAEDVESTTDDSTLDLRAVESEIRAIPRYRRKESRGDYANL